MTYQDLAVLVSLCNAGMAFLFFVMYGYVVRLRRAARKLKRRLQEEKEERRWLKKKTFHIQLSNLELRVSILKMRRVTTITNCEDCGKRFRQKIRGAPPDGITYGLETKCPEHRDKIPQTR